VGSGAFGERGSERGGSTVRSVEGALSAGSGARGSGSGARGSVDGSTFGRERS
jgi:hypothetical protein